jgi:ribosomal protein L32
MKYRKKPVVIEAVELKFSTDSQDEIIQWSNNTIQKGLDGGLRIPTLEGIMVANTGDYIIRGVKGEFYPCKPDIFEMTYELASTLPQQEICISCDEQKETHKICMDCIGKMIKENQQEISDEEIMKGAKEWYNKEGAYSASAIALKTWVFAIKWYREQLKTKKD